MTLLTIVQTALNETGGFENLDTVASNSNSTAQRALAIANRALKQVSKDIQWPHFKIRKTLNTVASQQEYDLPSDFFAMCDLTFWDVSNNEPVQGPLSPKDFETLENNGTVSSITTYFRIFRGSTGNARKMWLFPTPTDVRELKYEYESKALVQDAAGVLQSDKFENDDDDSLIDEDLIILNFKWRWLKSWGRPYAEELADYEITSKRYQGNEGNAITSFTDGMAPRRPFIRVPESGFGQ